MKILKFEIHEDECRVDVSFGMKPAEIAKFNIGQFRTPKQITELMRHAHDSDTVMRATFRAYDYPIEMYDFVTDRGRSGKFAKVVEIRRACMYQLRKHTDLSFPSIGKIFGFTHASVIHNVRTFQNLLDIHDEKTETADFEVEQILNELLIKD